MSEKSTYEELEPSVNSLYSVRESILNGLLLAITIISLYVQHSRSL